MLEAAMASKLSSGLEVVSSGFFVGVLDVFVCVGRITGRRYLEREGVGALPSGPEALQVEIHKSPPVVRWTVERERVQCHRS
jgi:hypothetical protein